MPRTSPRTSSTSSRKRPCAPSSIPTMTAAMPRARAFSPGPMGPFSRPRTESVARSLDLAVVRTTLTNTAYLSLAPARSARMGESLFTIGFPAAVILGQEATLTEGTVSALSGPGGETSFLQITAPVQPGNSGGPVVNYQGHIVGIVSSTIAALPFIMATGTVPQNINYAVKSDYARPLFEQPAPRPGAGSRAEAFERAKSSTCRIEVDI